MNKSSRYLTTIIIALVCALVSFDTVGAASPTGAIPGRFVVKMASQTSRTTLSAALSSGQRLGAISQLQIDTLLAGSEGWKRVFTIDADSLATAEQIREQLGPQNVEYVEPVYELEFFSLPTDPYFSEQWYLRNTGQPFWAVNRIAGDFNDVLVKQSGSAGNDIDLTAFYDSPPALSTKVVVAVVDTGVDPTHPELRNRFWRNPGEIPGNNIDDDHNGYVDDTLGYDISGDTVSMVALAGDNDPSDNFGHGTHIAGIIAASQNDQGIAGIASSAEIMAVKIRPNGTTTVGAAGIVYAVNSGAKVINISWGTPFESLLLQDAVRFAHDNGVLVCVSSGNSGTSSTYYPAAFDEVMAVGAGDANGLLTSFSTYGPHLDICAPGQNILSLRAAGTDMYASNNEPGVHIIGPDSLYYLADGTSMAAPMVAGAAALIWSIRPQLTLDQVIADLEAGARDMIDPWGIGDSLPGFDSLTGYGYLDIGRSLDITRAGGLYFVAPESHTRHIGQIQVKAAAIGGYQGGWLLHCALGTAPDSWHLLASGQQPPTDSLLFTLSDPQYTGHLTFRLTDDYGTNRYLSTVLVFGSNLELASPQPGSQYDYNVPIAGTVYGSDYLSVAVYYRPEGGTKTLLFETGGEYFDSLIYSWNASGVNLGEYTMYLEGHFLSGTVVDSAVFTLASAFAQGWPQDLSGRGALSATTADLDNDGTKEVIVGTTYGLNVFHSDGRPMEGFPALFGSPVRCIPAVYDVNRDGYQDIICTSDSGLHVFNHDGTYVAGWPIKHDLGVMGYGSPNPIVTRLDITEDSAIVVVDGYGEVLAYDFNGVPDFRSLEGWFASFNIQATPSTYYNGNGLSGTDLEGDGYDELVVSFSATSGYCGVGVFDGRTGQPAFGRPLPYVVSASIINGTVLADLSGDGLPEIITSGVDSTGTPTLWVKTQGTRTLAGWPRLLPEIDNWLGMYPMVADLDLDGIPEILVTFYEYDIGVLYIFRADGTPYVYVEGRPDGEAYRYAATFGVPIVANLLGDRYPEIVIRSGYIFPGTGREKIHILDHTITPVPGWPISTPTNPEEVFSTPYAPLVDDVDGDGLVELVLVSEGLSVYVWDFEASYAEGHNRGRVMMDNLNSAIYDSTSNPTDVPVISPVTLPREFKLYQNYPNPFNPSTAITFELPERAYTRLEVFNILGQKVATLIDQILPAGSQTIEFDASQCPSGVYFYRVQAGREEATRKMVIIK
jgi:subtilisin family serine protease